MVVVSFPEAEVPVDLRREMIGLQQHAWPGSDPFDTSAWHDESLKPLSLLMLDDDGRVCSALDILSKTISHRGVTYAASGISAMVTDANRRGRGYGRGLAQAALETMRSNNADLGIFTCDRDLTHFYRSAGWRRLAGSVLVGGTAESPYPSDQFDKVVMASFLGIATVHVTAWQGAYRDLIPRDHLDALDIGERTNAGARSCPAS